MRSSGTPQNPNMAFTAATATFTPAGARPSDSICSRHCAALSRPASRPARYSPYCLTARVYRATVASLRSSLRSAPANPASSSGVIFNAFISSPPEFLGLFYLKKTAGINAKT